MAMATIVLSKSLHGPKSLSSHRSQNPSFPFFGFPSSSVRYSRNLPWKSRLIFASASAAGSSGSEGDYSPYEVLGVSPIEGFDMMKAAYTRKRKAEMRPPRLAPRAIGWVIALSAHCAFDYTDARMPREETMKKLLQENVPASACSALFDTEEDGMSILIRGRAKDGLSDGCLVFFQLEKAYDKVMMAQLTNRKKSITFGSFKVSKDVSFADKEPIVPWGPRFTRSSSQDMKINLAIAAVFTAWVVFKRNAEYKPLQFLAFVFVYRIFEKLKAYESPVSPTFTEDGEDPGRGTRMGKHLLRSLALAFGCIAFASLAYTGILNLIEFVGGYVPLFLYNNQERLVTVLTAIMLYLMASYYR